MNIIHGKTVNKGIVLGPIAVFRPQNDQIEMVKVKDLEAEIQKMEKAYSRSQEQLSELYDKACPEVGEEGAAIFTVHKMMLEDELYIDAIYHMIKEKKVNAEYAVTVVGKQFAEQLSLIDDEYMKARSADVLDISGRLIQNMKDTEQEGKEITVPSIIVAEELTPSETMQMDKKKILAFVTVRGSANSHTAILARMMNIPALIGTIIELDSLKDGMLAAVDGFEGKFIVEPDAISQEQITRKIEKENMMNHIFEQLKGKDNITLDGRRIDVFANIGSAEDVECVLENDAGGIGLFRSEFLYLGKKDFPTEEVQFSVYKQVIQKMQGKKVIIRTLDIGADKQADYFKLEKEENPALGYRAIRICLTQPDIFKTQLKALLRAACYGNLSIMYPMITSTDEVEKIHGIVKQVAEELEDKSIPYRIPEQGIMIETPAAALISDKLAQQVDFFSIGTNDLTQYTLAIDRQNEKLNTFYNSHHEAILRLIKLVTENAHKEKKWVGICGELGADLTLTETFLDIGIDELSVAPGMVLELRKRIREIKK